MSQNILTAAVVIGIKCSKQMLYTIQGTNKLNVQFGQSLYNTSLYNIELEIPVTLWLPNFFTMEFYKAIIEK